MTETAPPAEATNSERARWAFERINAHDVDSLRHLWTTASVGYFADATLHGPEEFAAYFADKLAAIDGLHLAVVAVAEAGDDTFVHWRMTGRHTGPLLGIAATGRSIELDGMDHFVLRDGTVRTNTVVFDQMAFARQIGLLPPDRSATDRILKRAFNAKAHAAARLRRPQP